MDRCGPTPTRQDHLPYLRAASTVAYSSDATSRAGIHSVGLEFERMGWIFREQPTSDFGIDGQIEPRDPKTGRGTGRLVGCQIKAGKSYFSEETETAFIYRGTAEHLSYWLGHSLPVIVVLCDLDASRCYWQAINEHTITRTGTGWKTEVPKRPFPGTAANEYLERLADTGWLESTKTFATPDKFFEQVRRNPLFDYDQTFLGRATSIDELNAFLADTDKTVAVLTGRGGIGKTKLVRNWVSNLSDWTVLYRTERVPVHQGTENELTGSRILIIADDAHRQSDIDSLLQLVRDKKRDGMEIKILLSCRPIGSERINAALARSFEPADVMRMEELKQLSEREARQLAAEVLGPENFTLVPFLVSVSQDTPLVTVIGGRLLARQSINAAQLPDSEEFKHAVFDKFLEDYETATLHKHPNTRPLLQLIAAVQPIPLRSEHFAKEAASFIRCRQSEVLQAMDDLEACGLLYRTSNTYRIAPDMFADFLLEQACVRKTGESSKYADEIFAAFGNQYVSNLLTNVAELDFRVVGRGGSSLLSEVWLKIKDQFEQADHATKTQILEYLEPAAFFQPESVMDMIRVAWKHCGVQHTSRETGGGCRDLLLKLPPLLRAISYQPSFTSEAVQLLWDLTKGAAPEPRSYSQDAVRVLKQLASYSRYKSVSLNMKMAEIADAVKDEVGAFDRKFTPLDIVDTLLEREGEEHEYAGGVVTLFSFGLNYPVVRPVREVCFRIVEHCLHDPDPRKSCRAFASLSELLQICLPKFARELSEPEKQWHSEERRHVIGILAKRVGVPGVSLELAREVKDTLLDFWTRARNEHLLLEFDSILAALSSVPLLDSFDAFCRGNWDMRDGAETAEQITASMQRALEQGREAAAVFAARFPEPGDRVRQIAEFYKRAEYSRIEANGAFQFVEDLSDDPQFLDELARQIKGRSYYPHLAVTTQVVLRRLRQREGAEYLEFGLAVADSNDVVVVRSAAAALWGAQFGPKFAEDLLILKALARSEDLQAKRLVADGLKGLGNGSPVEALCIDLILGLFSGQDSKFFDHLCACFTYSGTPLANFTGQQLEQLANVLAGISDLDQHHMALVISWMATNRPEVITRLLTMRIQRNENEAVAGNWRYRLWPRSVSLRGLSSTGEYKNLLEMIFSELQKTRFAKSELGSLFWSIAVLDETAIGLFRDWLRLVEPQSKTEAVNLLSAGPGRLPFTHPELVNESLERAAEMGPDVLEKAQSRFINNCYVGCQIPPPSPAHNSAAVQTYGMTDAERPPQLKELYRLIEEASLRLKSEHEALEADFEFDI